MAQNVGHSIASEELQTPPWHSFIDQDAFHIVKRHAPTADTLIQRRRALAALKRTFEQNSGDRFSVIDISSYTYALDSEETTVSFSVTDSTPYAVESTANQPEYSTVPTILQDLIGASSSEAPFIPPYPSSLHDHLVPSIQASRDDFFFDVHPPSLFHEPMRDLLHSYSEYYSNLGVLLPLLDLWLGSHNIPASEVSATCLALLVISFLRSQYYLPSFQVPPGRLVGNPATPQGVWWPTQLPADPSPLERETVLTDPESVCDWCDLRVYTRPSPPKNDALPNTPIGEILEGFFRFWIKFGLNPKTHVVSIRGVPWPPRVIRGGVQSSNGEAGSVGSSSALLEDRRPSSWAQDVLVVQDPFLLTHNHAHSLSQETWERFLQACESSAASLISTAPLHAIFGPALDPLPRPLVSAAPPTLHPGINAYLNAMMRAQSPVKVLAARRQTIQSVSTAITRRFGGRYSVACFGSTRYGVDSATSDLDMVILDNDLPHGFHPNIDRKMLPAPYDMWKIKPVLQQAGFVRVFAIASATVPIVKFYDPRTRINIDLNCNNRLGSINTELLTSYCDAWSHLRPMIVYLKKWAKSVSLNDPSGANGPATFSSYCLTLMTVAFLQTKCVLPNLQASAVGHADQSRSGFWLLLKRNERLWCDTRYGKLSRSWSSASMTLEYAIYGWFRYTRSWRRMLVRLASISCIRLFRFFAYEHKWMDDILDIKHGSLLARQEPFRPPKEPKEGSKRPRQTKKKKRKQKAGTSTPEAGPATPVNDVVEEIAYSLEDPTVDLETEEPQTDDEVVDDQGGLDLGSRQPQEWQKSRLVVVDPFITAKNCASACSDKVQQRFQQECERAASMLEAGEPIESLFGRGSPLFHGPNGQPYRTRRSPAPRNGQSRVPSVGTATGANTASTIPQAPPARPRRNPRQRPVLT